MLVKLTRNSKLADHLVKTPPSALAACERVMDIPNIHIRLQSAAMPKAMWAMQGARDGVCVFQPTKSSLSAIEPSHQQGEVLFFAHATCIAWSISMEGAIRWEA